MKLRIKDACLFLICFLPALSFAAAKCIQYGDPVPRTKWSNQIFFDSGIASKFASTGSKFVRVNFLNPHGTSAPGMEHHFAQYDRIVDNIRNATTADGELMEIIGILSYDFMAGDYSSSESHHDARIENNAEYQGGNGYNTYLQSFADKGWQVMNRYKDKIKVWEIWNEPSVDHYRLEPSNFSWALYLMWHKIHIESDLHAEHDIRLISGGQLGHNIDSANPVSANAVYLENTYRQGHSHANWGSTDGAPFDYMGYHIYTDQGGVASRGNIEKYLDYVRQVMRDYDNQQREIWLTELGWTTQGSVSEAMQAENLTTAFSVLNGALDVRTACWFNLQDIPPASLYFGLKRPNGTNKLAYNKFVALPKDQWRVALKADNGQLVKANSRTMNLEANSDLIDKEELFTVIPHQASFLIRSEANGHYVGATTEMLHTTYPNITNATKFDMKLKDVRRVAFRSSVGKWVAAEHGGGAHLMANRDIDATWETFEYLNTDRPTCSVGALYGSNKNDEGGLVAAEGGGGRELRANRNAINAWETIRFQRLIGLDFAMQVANDQYVAAELGGGGALTANRNWIYGWETFTFEPLLNEMVTIKTFDNQHYLAVNLDSEGIVRANATSALDRTARFHWHCLAH